jgi:HEAT repeat protein
MRNVLVPFSLICLLLPAGQIPSIFADEKSDDGVRKLIAALNDSERAVVLSAIKKLGNHGNAAKQAVAVLGSRLADKDKGVATQAAQALAQIGAASVPALVKSLRHPSFTVRTRALLTLGTIGRDAKEAVLPVRELLKHKEAKVRLLAALVLGAMHEEARPVAASLEDALRDADAHVRFVAADSLYQIGPDTVKHLRAALKDGDVDVRLNALRGLARYVDSPEALKGLELALQDHNIRVRSVAAGGSARPSGQADLSTAFGNPQG